MKLITNIKNVALVLFIITGITHISAGLMLASNYLLPYSYIINRSFDIPFAMTAIIYGLTSIYSEIAEQHQKPVGVIFAVMTILIFGGLLYINLLVPDKTSLTSL